MLVKSSSSKRIDASAASLDLHYFLLVISSSIASFGLGLCATLAVASKQGLQMLPQETPRPSFLLCIYTIQDHDAHNSNLLQI
jgi:hypothetical protein